MTWMLTLQGRVLDLLAPLDDPHAWDIGPLSHSLACINRFTGHALRPISVAEHSLLVCDIVALEFGMGVHAQLAALMHDAHESACNDLAAPAKDAIGAPWHAFERELESAVHTVYGLKDAFRLYGAAIKRADLIALATERRDLMHPGGGPWHCLQGVQPLTWLNLRSRDHMTWQDWRQAFADRYGELEYARQNP